MEINKRSISKINPTITENTEFSIIKVHALFINLKVDVSLDHNVSLASFHFQLSEYFGQHSKQAKNNLRSTPASSALTLVSHQSHSVCAANHHLRGSGERNEAQR